jgi:hypothetical protein
MLIVFHGSNCAQERSLWNISQGTNAISHKAYKLSSSVSGLLFHDLPITSILVYIHSIVTVVRFHYWTAQCSLSFMAQIVLEKDILWNMSLSSKCTFTQFINCHSSVSCLLYHDLPVTSVLKFIHSLVTAVGYKALFEGYFISLVILNNSSGFCLYSYSQ